MPRVRSAKAHEQVLDAAQVLFSERGIDGASMDAIAEASGVSKATIYKHWPDKDALCSEVVYRLKSKVPSFDTGDVRADLKSFLRWETVTQKSEQVLRLVQHLQAYAMKNPDFALALRSRVMEPAIDRITEIIRRGIRDGALRNDLKIELGVAMILGPIMYRHFVNLMNKNVPEEFEESIVDAFWRAYAADPASERYNAPLRAKR